MIEMIDVIIPVYNNADTLDAAVQSVVGQSVFPRIRVLISDDASTDGSAERATAWAEKYSNISLNINSKNLGVMGNYRKLLSKCDSTYVAPLEADDVWTSNMRLQLLKEWLDHSETACCFNYYTMREDNQYRLPPIQCKPDRYSRLSAFDLIAENSPGSFTNCLYRTETFRNVLDETQNSFGYDWMINTIIAARQSGMDFLPTLLSSYQLSPNGAWSSLARNCKIEKTLESPMAIKEFISERYAQNISLCAERLRRELRHD